MHAPFEGQTDRQLLASQGRELRSQMGRVPRCRCPPGSTGERFAVTRAETCHAGRGALRGCRAGDAPRAEGVWSAAWVNGLMTLGFAGARQQTNLCNESLMLEKLPACGKSFEEMMKKVDSKKWCNLTEFIMYYDNFTQCTEREANNASCFWPNPLAEGFITGIHKQFFSNCTSEKVHWEDPPDEILITLILIPVMLTCAMITLVVWCSKRSDILV
ncbi:receptor activity-modifying protein 3 [Egretta garzetta]|uniref:receptor activity-modifying protein 3 n=1 Tax=Egretta garzetta TaxID=188379 RepID=UPI00163CF766|nr:receptor activity-modifying protein 3 [Egretta garzetta]